MALPNEEMLKNAGYASVLAGIACNLSYRQMVELRRVPFGRSMIGQIGEELLSKGLIRRRKDGGSYIVTKAGAEYMMRLGYWPPEAVNTYIAYMAFFIGESI